MNDTDKMILSDAIEKYIEAQSDIADLKIVITILVMFICALLGIMVIYT